MTLLVAEDLTTADDDILVPSLFAYAYRLASPSLLFDSVRVQGRVNASPIHRIRKTIEGLLEEYGEKFEQAYRMSFSSFCDLHTLLHTSILSAASGRDHSGFDQSIPLLVHQLQK